MSSDISIFHQFTTFVVKYFIHNCTWYLYSVSSHGREDASLQLMLNGYTLDYNEHFVGDILDDCCFLTFSSCDGKAAFHSNGCSCSAENPQLPSSALQSGATPQRISSNPASSSASLLQSSGTFFPSSNGVLHTPVTVESPCRPLASASPDHSKQAEVSSSLGAMSAFQGWCIQQGITDPGANRASLIPKPVWVGDYHPSQWAGFDALRCIKQRRCFVIRAAPGW